MTGTVVIDEGAPRVRARANVADSKRRRTRLAPRPKAKSRSKPRPKVAAKARAKAAPAETWIAQFIYAGPDGTVKVALMTITAESIEAARAFAAAHPPADEFVVSLNLRSDEQFLGQVRQKALAAAAKSA